MRKLIFIGLTLAFLVGMNLICYADDEIVKVKVNGEEINSDVPAQIKNDKTMIPLRFIVESLKATVSWDDETQTAIIVKGSKTITFKIGERIATVNDEEHILDAVAILKDDRVLVPLRFISEILGSTIEWDESTNTVLITDNFVTNTSSEVKTSKKNVTTLYDKAIEVINEIITPEMSDFEKELAIHDYIAFQSQKYSGFYTDFDNQRINTAEGVLIDGQATSKGISEAANLLFSIVGIDCITITSSNNRYAWNIIKLNDKYYHLDISSDVQRNGCIKYCYFNVSDKEMMKQREEGGNFHSWNNPESYPSCTDNSFSYLNNISMADHLIDISKRVGSWYYYVNKYSLICKIKVDKSSEEIELPYSYAKSFTIENDWIYYIGNRKNKFGIYKIKIDGTNEIKLKELSTGIDFNNIVAQDGWIYYKSAKFINSNILTSGIEKSNIYKMKIDGTNETSILEVSNGGLLYMLKDSWIYYLYGQPQKQYKMKLDGSEKQLLDFQVTW